MKIEGTLLRIFQTKNIKNFKITDFVVKQADGKEVKCTTFGSLPVVGSEVTFDVTPNDKGNPVVTKGTSVNVREEVSGKTTTATAEQPVADVPATTTKRSYAKKASTASDNKHVSKPAVETGTGREAYRGEAEESVKTTLNSAIALANSLDLSYTLADLVNLSDLMARTQTAIFLDKQKDNRVASFNRK